MPFGQAEVIETHKNVDPYDFSDQSKYNGIDGYAGGTWSEENGKTVYRVSKSNTMSKAQLKRYFERVEPDVILIDER